MLRETLHLRIYVWLRGKCGLYLLVQATVQYEKSPHRWCISFNHSVRRRSLQWARVGRRVTGFNQRQASGRNPIRSWD